MGPRGKKSEKLPENVGKYTSTESWSNNLGKNVLGKYKSTESWSANNLCKNVFEFVVSGETSTKKVWNTARHLGKYKSTESWSNSLGKNVLGKYKVDRKLVGKQLGQKRFLVCRVGWDLDEKSLKNTQKLSASTKSTESWLANNLGKNVFLFVCVGWDLDEKSLKNTPKF